MHKYHVDFRFPKSLMSKYTYENYFCHIHYIFFKNFFCHILPITRERCCDHVNFQQKTRLHTSSGKTLTRNMK